MKKDRNDAEPKVDSQLDCSVSQVRPSDGLEMMKAFAEGNQCVIPRKMVKMSLEFLEYQLGDWSVKVDEFSDKRFAVLTPTDDTPQKFKRHLTKPNV